MSSEIIQNQLLHKSAHDKMELFENLEGSFYCYCYAIDRSPLKNDPKFKQFFKDLDETSLEDSFRVDGCKQIDRYYFQVIIWGIEISLTLAVFNSLSEIVTVYITN